MDPKQTPSSDELQFNTAEVGSADAGPLACGACQNPLYGVYFEINGQPCCERCRYEVENERTHGSGAGRLMRALLAGGLAALVGAGIYYAVLALTGYEVGLVAIVVGFLVGAGVRWGSRGQGGWAYQSLAVALTYMAIVSTYVPLIFQEFENMEATEVAESQAPEATAEATLPGPDAVESAEAQLSPAAAPAAGSETLSVDEPVDFTVTEAVVGLAVFGALVLALPFLGGFQNIMGLIIIGIGLYQAWSMNKRLPLEVEGPFQVARAPAAPLPDRGAT